MTMLVNERKQELQKVSDHRYCYQNPCNVYVIRDACDAYGQALNIVQRAPSVRVAMSILATIIFVRCTAKPRPLPPNGKYT